MLRAVGRLHRAARVLYGKRTWLCTARAVWHHAVRAREGQTAAGECDREPLDVEDGATPTSRTTPLASWPPTVPRRAWQIANSVSQLLTSDASGRGFWAWHMPPSVVSATRIAVRLLQRTGDEYASDYNPVTAAAIPDSCVCSDAVAKGRA